MKPALEDLAVPAPIAAEEDETGPAALAMAAAALDEDVDAAQLAERLDPTSSAIELAHRALALGYHVSYHTPVPDEVPETTADAGLLVRDEANPGDVETALAARHPAIVSGPGDGVPFLLVLRRDGDALVVDDPSVEERPLTWSLDRLADLLAADPPPRALELAPRTRADR